MVFGRDRSSPYNSSSSPTIDQMYPNVVPHCNGFVGPSNHHHSPLSSSSGLSIRVFIKPEYRITPLPHLSSHSGDIPRSNFQFDFGLERKILDEANKENPNWSMFDIENIPTKATKSTSPKVSVSDPIVSKYIAMGLSREAIPIAVANYGDNPVKIPKFAKSYTLLREMGFSSTSVVEALVMYDNDTDKALTHFLNGSS
ncbi:uncharacterized protein LOC109789572 [Cajanus cajan]|uniref:UBA domain-containing protein n=1 Tax=Cajanus cajan TaxID=3821 RepID=A0A151R6S1_CAJCA|nr:uncharacterized protein LOC109789572 [Cajanus cajan]KYP38203.1 hypothetical protein KK1_040567 [Cajanus cajan]